MHERNNARNTRHRQWQRHFWCYRICFRDIPIFEEVRGILCFVHMRVVKIVFGKCCDLKLNEMHVIRMLFLMWLV